ncbi:uracil-DNA glycosylase [Candidatus Liberibacter americanus]|uniref:Uracil-DNA glycosylase n=1 Tax=Candidatus Liberibacter americanus str. Sao Paulo TaxID=1261131 RepID=U6B4N6_9HYPH|nr:uracil-DNA glycosylase [Candidatus Liberibacter americanus]AHA27588.1 Uracil-DNA glycosylase [Candidatus Liberibacter americanus str. Sao Paulo]EMS36451.1 uracil-DNA glycosylase [Candidatus Liberibacter americanus PW_SP]
MTYVEKLSRAEMLTTALFYADSGVHWLFENSNDKENETIIVNIENEQDSFVKSTSKSINADLNINDSVIEKAYSITESATSLHELKLLLSSFNDCKLLHTARTTICADQEYAKDVMIIGYTPSDIDDINGKPFSGKTGDMLNEILKSIKINREETCISMISPWRPPGNRKLSTIEIEICRPIIIKQIELAAPKIILLLGKDTKKIFFKKDKTYNNNLDNYNKIIVKNKEIPTISIAHPQEMIEHTYFKKDAWISLIEFKKKIESIKKI